MVGRSVQDGQVKTHVLLAHNSNVWTKIRSNLHFLSTLATTLRCCAEIIDKLEFFQSVNFDFIYSLRNTGTKYLLFFDNSCEESCNSKVLDDIAVAGRHRGLSTIYKKHNLFHQSKFGRDVEIQNTHIVFSKSPCSVMQGSTPSAQLGLGSELVDWYRDATSVPSVIC